MMNLQGMTMLNLSSNNLSGIIPKFLWTFRSLQYLNLSFNGLNGEVPTTGAFGNSSQNLLLGNKGLCGGDPALGLPSCSVLSSGRGPSSHALVTIVPPVAGVVLLLLITVGFCYRWHRSKGKKLSFFIFQDDNYRKVSYREIVRATTNFSSANIIGAGSFGTIYRAKIDFNEHDVEVKVINAELGEAMRSFADECRVLRNIRHQNLVKIITLCSSMDNNENEFKALIYNYMPNGSLDKWLHPENLNPHYGKMFGLMNRLNIVIDVACAMEYLHHYCVPPVIHYDLKPSNILLDSNMIALGDFGLARFLAAEASSTMGIKGSIGYVAPEYGMGNHISP